jgi:hypothetical protein
MTKGKYGFNTSFKALVARQCWFAENLAPTNSMMTQLASSPFKSLHELIDKFLLVSDSRALSSSKVGSLNLVYGSKKGDKGQVGTPPTRQ